MKKRLLGSIMSVMLVASMLMGCGASSSSEEGGEDVAVEEGEAYKIGMTFDLSNPTWAELVKAAVAHGEELNLEVTYVDSKSDSAKQVTQIENFIQSGMDAIVICAVESNAIESVAKEAMDAGIKVVAYTQVIENCDAEYLVDAYNTGYACGERAAAWINENYGDEAEVQWALMDLPEFPEIIDRANGIIAGVEENTENTKLVNTASALTTEEGLANAENFLQANPDIKAICCIGSGGGTGGNEGIKSSGITDFESIGVFGIDATEPEILNIINKDPQKSSVSLGGGSAHGVDLIDMAADLLNGVEIETTQYMPIQVIDGDNAQEYYDTMYAK